MWHIIRERLAVSLTARDDMSVAARNISQFKNIAADAAGAVKTTPQVTPDQAAPPLDITKARDTVGKDIVQLETMGVTGDPRLAQAKTLLQNPTAENLAAASSLVVACAQENAASLQQSLDAMTAAGGNKPAPQPLPGGNVAPTTPTTPTTPTAPTTPATRPDRMQTAVQHVKAEPGFWSKVGAFITSPSFLTKVAIGVGLFVACALPIIAAPALIGLLGGAAVAVGPFVLPAVVFGCAGMIIGATYFGESEPSIFKDSKPAQQQSEPDPQPVQQQQQDPVDQPQVQGDAAAYMQQVDQLLARTQQVRQKQDAAALYDQLSQAITQMQARMKQDQADAAKQGEFSRRLVLANQARETLQKQYGLPAAS